MRALFFKELFRNRTSFIVYCVIIAIFVWTYVALFPSVQDQSESFEELLKTMPEAMRQAFGITEFGFDSLESFMGVELMSLMWPILAILLATSRASSSIAGDIESRTIGLALNLPISRSRILTAKILSASLALIFFTFVTMFSVLIFAAIYSIEVSAKNITMMFVLGSLFIVAFYSLSLCISSFSSEKGKVYFTMGSFAVISYAINIISALNSSLETMKYLSIFYYFDYNATLTNATISITNFAVFGILIAGPIVVSLYRFVNRDISI